MTVLRLLGAALLLAGLGWCLARVVAQERAELEHHAGPAVLADLRRTDPHRTEQTVRLTEVRLREDERYLVELCAAGAVESWEGALHLVLWRPATERLVFRTPLDSGRSRRGRTCWTVGIGDVPETGRFALEAFWPTPEPLPVIDRTPIEVRVNAYRLPGATDRIALAVLGLGVILLVAGLARSASAAPARAPATGALVLGLCGLALLVWASGLRPGGATGLLAAGLVVAAGQLALVWVLALRQSSGAALDALALHRPARHWLWAPCVAAGLCALVPVVLQRLVPPTGEAPVEVAIAWPSGKLAFAALGLVVPVAEEVFFRGFVYSALRARLSGPLAVLAASALFALAHVPQSFGDWASLGAIASTGLVLTLLRHLSGALWPSIAAHLLYNGALVLLAWS